MSFKALFSKKNIRRTHHYFPMKKSTFRERDLIEGIKTML